MKKNDTCVSVGRTTGCLLSCFMAFGAYADGYVTLTKSSNTTKGFANADWSETVDDPSTRDYLVNNERIFFTTSFETVTAHSLTLGEVGGTAGNFWAYYSATFNNEGIIFANGEAYPRASEVEFSGKATFTSPESAPYRFHGEGWRPRGFTFNGDVHSDIGKGFLAYSQLTNGFYIAFTGDTSDYLGSVVVTSQYDSAGAPLGSALRLSGSASYFGGFIVMRDGTTFNPQITTSVGSLTLDEGSSLSLVAGSTLTVRTALTVNGGPVPIALSGAPSAEVAEVTRYALITMPADSACTEADFSLPNYGSNLRTAPHLYMETSGEMKTLYAAYYPTVSLTVKNNGSAIGDTTTESAITSGTYWSDGEPVHGFAHYLVGRISGTTGIMTPYDLDGVLVFPGFSLMLGEYTQVALRTGDYTISNLWFNCGSNGTVVYGLDGTNVTLRGKFSVNEDGIVSFGPRKGGSIRMVGPISGPASSLLNICGSAAGTSQCRGIVILDGDNSAYAGKMTVTIDYPGNLRFDDRFMSLRVSDAASLGGAMPEFAYDALKIEHAGRLEAYDSFTLDEPTRGVFVSGQGRFYVEANKTLSVKEQLTVNGRAYKEGPGMLTLGGALRFLDSEGALTETPPAEATNRTFYVTGGRIKPLSAHSLDGLDVVFSNKTSKLDVGIALDIEPTDAELLAKGLCNAKSENPFSVQSDNANEKIKIALECADPAEGKIYEFAVMTLTNTVADTVFDRLAFTRPEGFSHYKLNLERISDAEAGTKTLRATFKKCGFMLSFW